MTANPFPFKVLFCFENASKVLIEIKRTDIQSEDKGLVYKWLGIQKGKQNEEVIRQLTFQSMEQAGEEQTRQFFEGTLTWNADNAVFNDEALTQVEAEDVPKKWLKKINDYLD